jgi:hypothetical protein
VNFILIVILNWMLKLFAAWIMYLLATWLQAPEWVMTAMIAVGACETKLSVEGEPLIKRMGRFKFTGRT